MISIISLVAPRTSGLLSNTHTSATAFGTTNSDPNFNRVQSAFLQAAGWSDIPSKITLRSSEVCCEIRSRESKSRPERTFSQPVGQMGTGDKGTTAVSEHCHMTSQYTTALGITLIVAPSVY